MTRTIVVDASFITSLLAQSEGATKEWELALIDGAELAAPHLMPVEVTSALRSAERQGLLSSSVAALAHRDLVDLGVDLFPFEPFASRVWALRHSVSPYDGWYIALAERLDAPLVTLDQRLTRAADAQCQFVLPPQ